MINDIDDRVLNFSKHGIDISKAPKKGQTLYANEVKPEAIKKDVAKL